MKIEQKYWLLIQRYITGNASMGERNELERWMNESSENRQLVQKIKKVWELTPSEDFDVDVQKAWKQFQIRHHDKDDATVHSIGYARNKIRIPLYLLRTAAVILVALFAWFFVQYQLNMTEKKVAEQAVAFNVLQELKTENGEKARVTFSDGTEVTLNSASLIKFPQEFHGSTREIYLEGEAYFEVAPNPDQPFIVHSQDARIEVLGTGFSVRGWNEDPSVEVVVSHGKVSVQSLSIKPENRSDVILLEGLKTEIKRGENPITPTHVNPLYHLLWTSGGMHFDNEPISQVFKDLERRFDIEIELLDPEILNIPYTGTFQYADLDEVLSVIAASVDLEYSRNRKLVEFKKPKDDS